MKRLTILLGPPCSGKSTRALATTVPRFSVRHWFESQRDALALPPAGTFLADEQVIQAVCAFLQMNDLAKDVVLDGFPGNSEQLAWVMNVLAESWTIRYVYCPADYQTALQRATTRQVCFRCDGGADPVVPSVSGRCPVCGSALGRRPDDTAADFQTRWEHYHERARQMYLQDAWGQYRAAVDAAHGHLLGDGIRIDMHLHTTASDGVDTPAEMLDKSVGAGIALCSITDHDTLSGLEETIAHAQKRGLPFIPGIEVSALFHNRLIHVLGYGIHLNETGLEPVIKGNQQARRAFDARVLFLLQARGIMDQEASTRYAGYVRDKRKGGWKLLAFLIDEGICEDGFDYLRLMKELEPGEIQYLPAEEVVCAISSAGICVLAHPGAYQWPRTSLSTYLDELRNMGLHGIECYHPQNDASLTGFLLDYCRQWHLAITGGSDDHGNLPDRKIGTPYLDSQIISSSPIAEKILWADKQE